MAFCRNCGKEIDDEIKVCPHCGTACDGLSATGISDGGVDYNELKFSANLVSADRNRKCVAILNLICFVMIVIEVIVSMVGSSNIISVQYADAIYRSSKTRLMIIGVTLLQWAMPIIILIVTLVMSVKVIKKEIKIFKNSELKTINENATVGNLHTLSQFTTISAVLPILMLISSAYRLFEIILEGETSGVGLSLYMREPELVSLMYGTTACSRPYIAMIFGVLGLSFFVYSQIVASRHNNIYRYFKSKLAPDMPAPIFDKNASKEAREKNRKLIEAAQAVKLGSEYTELYQIYAVRFPTKSGEGNKAIKFNIKSEAASTKLFVMRWLWRGIPALLAVVLAIVWISVAVTHSKVVVRPGSVGKIRLGDSAETVKNKLGKPGIGSSEFQYIYTDSDKIEDFEDLMNAEIRQLCVYFENGKVSEIKYDVGKSDDSSSDFLNIKKTITRKIYFDSENGSFMREEVALYNDGSVRVYREKY